MRRGVEFSIDDVACDVEPRTLALLRERGAGCKKGKG
jgi:hypothetical protein